MRLSVLNNVIAQTIEMWAKLRSAITATVALCGCLMATLMSMTGPAYGSDELRSCRAMWSWQETSGSWYFSFVADRSVPPYWTEKEILGGPKLKGLASVEKYISSLEPGTTVIWRDLPPRKIITYPPRSVARRLVEFAKRHSVNIEQLPTLNE
jgi:hypothetical protein